MIDRREILDIAGVLGLLPQVVEKDYVLGWVLAGIYQHAALAENWIFKGGTCLKKCYFETHRFSEDLDFSLIDPSDIDQEVLVAVFSEIGEWIYEGTGIEIPEELLEFEIFENPRGTVSCQGKLSYRGPIAPRSGGLPRIKLDLTLDELLVLPPPEHVIFHDYSTGVKPPVPATYQMAAGEIVLRERTLRLPVSGAAQSFLEIIRFAAANHLCVDLEYEESVRRLEPYSLRRTRDGNIVLHAIKASDGGHLSFRVDRIQGAQTTGQSFLPRYAVELSPQGSAVKGAEIHHPGCPLIPHRR